jgi:hypothetical protein
MDCAGVCNGDAALDDCGVCNGGNAAMDCAGVCNGDAALDECGVCNGGNAAMDCAGECNGDAALDECGVCNGDNAAMDCAGVCNGDAALDDCGDCNGGNAAMDCAGVCNGVAVEDECGECGGGGIADGACDCDGNVVDCAGECGGSAENCPDWEDIPGDYEFTASMTAVALNNDGDALGDDGDMLAAFDGDGNVRGISTMLDGFGPTEGLTLHSLTIRSNAAGDAISFQYYDASEDEVMQSGTSYTFVINDLLGGLTSPYEINVGTISLSIDMAAGWNWFSVNVAGDDMSPDAVLATLNPELNDIVKNQSDFAQYYGAEYGWVGSLLAIDPTSMYMISTSNPGTLDYAGVPVSPAATPISISAGWNWIGYLPQSSIATNDALGTVSAELNDIVKNQSDFAQYYGAEYGWVGSLANMSPGKGYMLSVSYESTLVYPDGSSGMARMVAELEKEKVLPSSISSWAVNQRDYEFNATMTISVDSRSDFDGDFVGVFVGSECRGIAGRREFVVDGSYNYSVMVYSNVAEGEKLTFKYYSSLDDEIINYGENEEFAANENYGNGFSTFGLSRETKFGQPTAYGLSEAYPNPFNPVTNFEYTIEEDGMVNVAVYDISGRMVAELVNGYQSAGSYPVVWDAQEFSSGVYMVNMTAGNYSTIQKVMLIK